MAAFTYHVAFEFKTGLRNATLLLMNYLFPLGFYVVMGLVFTQVNPFFKGVMAPAMVIFAVMASTILGLPGPLVESREAGIYRSYRVNGIPAASIVAIPMLTTIVHALIVSAIIALTVPLFGGLVPSRWGAFIGLILLTAFTCGAFGALIGVASTSSRATVLWSQLIFLPSMILGGLMLPLELLPASVRPISALLPTAHAMQAFLGLAYGQKTVLAPLASVAILATSALLAFGLAIYLFNWDSRNLSRRGHPLLALLAMVPYVVAILL